LAALYGITNRAGATEQAPAMTQKFWDINSLWRILSAQGQTPQGRGREREYCLSPK